MTVKAIYDGHDDYEVLGTGYEPVGEIRHGDLEAAPVIINPDSNTPIFRPDIVGEYDIKVVIKQGDEVLTENVVAINAGVDDIYPAKPSDHIETTDICLACHLQNSWIVEIVDHSQVIGACRNNGARHG